MKKLSVIALAFLSGVSFGQNTWDGGSVSTVTTNGNVGIGTVSSTIRLNMNTTANTIPHGIYNTVNNTYSGTQYGIANSLAFAGSGTKYGFYNVISNTGTSGGTYGNYVNLSSSSTSSSYGTYTTMGGTGNGVRYGNYVNMAGTGTGTKYGVYVNVTNGGTGDTRYGVYSVATGSGSKAGYFQGDLEARGNIMASGNNESRFIFHTSWLSGGAITDQWLSIAPNNTSGQNDWDFANSLTIYNSGLMEKSTNTADKAFTVHREDTDLDVFRVYGDGKVYATEVNVMLSADFPDYVFEPNYQLMPLQEVKSYIQENGHLPNVPSALDVQRDGMDVGEMNRVLVEKVEELTLYLLKQQEEIDELKAKIEAQH